MSTEHGASIERSMRRALAPICIATGAVLTLGFFFPPIIGDAVANSLWLAISVAFFCSGLGYLALLPSSKTETEESDELVLYRILTFSPVASVRTFLGRHDPIVAGVPTAVLAVFFAVLAVFPSRTTGVTASVQEFILHEFGWLFSGIVLLSVLFCLVILLGPWGEIKLGGPDSEPTYTYPTYFTLVFTAGIAAGIVFWGPAEALFHFQNPPPGLSATPATDGAIVGALSYTLFHWGVSAWSAYIVVGVPIAYFVYQRGAPLRVAALLTPILGTDGVNSVPGRLIDTLAIFATIGGIATSVALVANQFLIGVDFQWGVVSGRTGTLLFIAGLAFIYVIAATTGIHRGIRRIAGVNIVLFGLFIAVFLAVGPRSFIFERGTAALGQYAVDFVPMSLEYATDWSVAWTLWNWSWWFSWAPFAGLFIAAISRGRRLRTVVFTGVVATSAATALWFILVGGTALHIQQTGRADVLGAISARGGSQAVAGFPIFETLPLGDLLTFLFLMLIVVFITTSASASTLVVSVLTTRVGTTPSAGGITFWGVFQAIVAIVALLSGGGETLQAIAVLTGGPFAVLSVVGIVGLLVTFLRNERGRRSLFRALWERLPDIAPHYGLDPPEK